MKKLGFFSAKGRKTLEDLFFLKQDAILMEEFRHMEQMKETKESLAKVSGITNDEILQKLVDLDVRPDVVASLALVPLIEVAWADGCIEAKEKSAVLDAASHTFFAKDSIDYKLLTQWLEHRPPRNLLDAWTHYIQGLCEKLTTSQKTLLKNELIGHARQIAQAAGGFLGLGNKISEEEQRILDYLESVFD